MIETMGKDAQVLDSIKAQRDLTPGRFVARAVAGVPAVLRCAAQFKNWDALLKLYVRPRQLEQPFVARGRAGFSVTHWEPSDVQTTFAVFCARDYHLPRGADVVLDLGANIGVFSVYAAKVMGARRVVALEPVSATFRRLEHNLAANQLDGAVTAVPKGIGGATGTRTIYLGVTSPFSSLYYRGNPNAESGETEEVDIVTLERLLRDLSLDRVDVCKMDCEGAEVEALLAADDDVLRRIKVLTMEYHFPRREGSQERISDREAFFGRLERAGFVKTWEARRGTRATFVRN